MDIASYTPIIGIMGLIIGSSITYLFNLKSEKRKIDLNLQRDAYIDFIKSCSAIAMYQKHNDQIRVLENLILLTEAKTKIAIYGSARVVKAAADFFRKYGMLESKEAYFSYVDLVSIIRNETSLSKAIISNKDIGILLFNVDIDEDSFHVESSEVGID